MQNGINFIKNRNEAICTFIPNLYDPNFYKHLYDHYYFDVFQKNSADYKNYEYSYYNSNKVIFSHVKKQLIQEQKKVLYILALNVIIPMKKQIMNMNMMMIVGLVR